MDYCLKCMYTQDHNFCTNYKIHPFFKTTESISIKISLVFNHIEYLSLYFEVGMI